MDKKDLLTAPFTDEDFFEVIKDDPKAIEDYKTELALLFVTGIIPEKEVIRRHLKLAQVSSIHDLSFPQLMRLSHFLTFIRFLP